MTIINSALEEERELEAADGRRRQELIDRSKGDQGKQPVSLLHGNSAPTPRRSPVAPPQ